MDKKQKQYEQALEKKKEEKEKQKLEEEAKKFTRITFKYKLLWVINNFNLIKRPQCTSAATVRLSIGLPYFHHGCDWVDDVGWGRGYRVLQMMCKYILIKSEKKDFPVPSIKDIQKILVRTGHKPKSFQRSKEPIGAKEAMIVLEAFYSHKAKLLETNGVFMNSAWQYFEKCSGFGILSTDNDEDCRGICGVYSHFRPKYSCFMLVDPGYIGIPKDVDELRQKEYVYWKKDDEFGSENISICFPNL